MAGSSANSHLRKELAMGDRIARQASRIKKQSLQPRPPKSPGSNSSGPSFISQLAKAIQRPGVTASARPTTADGTSAYHFSVTPITKGSIATAMLSGASRPGAAVAHQKYVEREGAAENLGSEIERLANGVGAEQQEYLERDGVVEHGRTLASFGNISNSYEERLAFWKAVEDHEYSPKSHLLTIDPSRDPDLWNAIDTISLEAPNILLTCDRSKKCQIRISDALAVDVIKFAKAHGKSLNDKASALAIETGPGGRIQTRIIAELPHEIDAEKRIEVVRRFCEDRIATIEPDRDGKKMTLRYWAVIHAPDDHNDKRNNHLHVVFYERPTDKIIDKKDGIEKWDFTVSETYVNYRKTRTRKIEQERSRVIHAKSWVNDSRVYFAKLVNEALEQTGVNRRIDARSYKALGIDATPIPRIGPKAYQKEKRGIATAAGDVAIAAQWDRETTRLSAIYDHVVYDNDIVERFTTRIAKLRKQFDPRAPEADGIFASWKTAFFKKRDMLAERAAVLHNYQKVRSRLTPPLDPRKAEEIADTKDLIDDLQKESLAPFNKGYRAALIEERKALSALTKLETNRRTQIGPTLAPAQTAVALAPKASKSVGLPAAIAITAPRPVPPKVLVARPPMAALKPQTPRQASAKTIAPGFPPRPAPRTTHDQPGSTLKAPGLKAPQFAPRATAAPTNGIKITEPPKPAPASQAANQLPKDTVPAKLSDYKKRIFDAISSLTDSFQNPDFLNNYIASMNEPVDMNIINSKAIKEIAELDRKIAEEKTAIDAMLRNGVKIPDMIGWHAEGAKYVSERIKIIEAEKTSPPVPVVTQPVSTPAPAQPLEFYEAYQAARAAQAKRAIEAEQKAAETAPVLSGHAATPTAAPPEPMPPEAAVTQSTPAPVPQPAAAPRKKVFSRPLADVIAKRGVNRRTLTDKERHDLAFPDTTKIDPTTLADLVKASEAAPPQARASPAHAPQPAPLPPPRTEDVQRTPPERSPLPLSQTSISPAAPDRHGGNSAAATQTNLAPQIEPAKKAPAESAAPTATIPAPPTAPGTTVVQQKLSASETTATPQEPSPPTTKAVTAPEPDAQGPIIPITDNPKKKRKKRGEMSIEERRRVLIAQQKARSGPSR